MKQWGRFSAGDAVRFVGKRITENHYPPVGTVGVVVDNGLNDSHSVMIQWPIGSIGYTDGKSFIMLHDLTPADHAEQSDNLIAPTFEELTGFKEE